MEAMMYVLIVLVILFSYTTYNLLRKNEKCEDIIKSYENYINNISNIIETSDKKIQEVDRKGSFESDDEVGFFFKQLKDLQDQLNKFKVDHL